MRKIKSLSFFILTFAFILSLCSCQNNEPVEEKPSIDMTKEITNEWILSTISVDTSKAKTEFYLGEEFTSEGIFVTANYTKIVDGQIESKTEECNKYYIKTDEVDMNSSGEYPVYVVFRSGTKVVETSYKIKVKASIFEESSVDYIAGLKTVIRNSNGDVVDVVEVLMNSSLESSYSLAISGVYFNGKNPVLNADGSMKEKTINKKSLVITGYDEIDTSKVGTYLVNYKYSGPKIVIDGKEYDNEVSTFVIFKVVDPVVSIEFDNNNVTTFAPTIGSLDLSSWTIKVTRQVSGEKNEKFNKNEYVLSGVVNFLAGEYPAILMHIESGKMISCVITINSSNNILDCTDLSNFVDAEIDNEKVIKLVSNAEIYTDIVAGGNYTKDRKDSYGAITFPCRMKVGIGNYISVKMEKAGRLVIYIATSGDDAREMNIISEELNYSESISTTAVKQQIVENVLELEAGTYLLKPVSLMYVHGFIISYNE